MYKNEKARSSAASLKRERHNNIREDDITSSAHNITNADNQQGFICQILPHGEANAIKSSELLKILGLSDLRTMRRLIEKERICGALILSSDNGYFAPSDNPLEAVAEIERYLKVCDSRVKTNRMSIAPAKRALRRLNVALSGQEVIPDE